MITFTKSLTPIKEPKRKEKKAKSLKTNEPLELRFLSKTYIDFTLGKYEKLSPDLDKILNQIKEQPILAITAKDELLEVTASTFNLIVHFKGKNIKIDYYDTTK